MPLGAIADGDALLGTNLVEDSAAGDVALYVRVSNADDDLNVQDIIKNHRPALSNAAFGGFWRQLQYKYDRYECGLEFAPIIPACIPVRAGTRSSTPHGWYSAVMDADSSSTVTRTQHTLDNVTAGYAKILSTRGANSSDLVRMRLMELLTTNQESDYVFTVPPAIRDKTSQTGQRYPASLLKNINSEH